MQCKQHNEAQGRKENVPVLDVEIRRHRLTRGASAPTIARALAVGELRLRVELPLPHAAAGISALVGRGGLLLLWLTVGVACA